MVTKRQSLNDEINRGMEARAISGQSSDGAAERVTDDAQKMSIDIYKPTKGYKNTVVSIRFDEGDYEKLKVIAQEQGTNGAALIRKAVKDIIKEYGIL